MTFFESFQVWTLYSVMVLPLVGRSDRWGRIMIWLAFWIPGTPVRPPMEDLFWMISCYVCTEVFFQFMLRNFFTGAVKTKKGNSL